MRGGTGEAKCGGNYAAANRAGDKALEKGYSQVLWLDGVERKYVEEGGGMNVMFKIAGTVVTPMLTGSILPGITRKSCIELLKSWGVPVEERLLSVDELFEAAKNGTLEEAWCVGTAAVISPIGELAWNEETFEVNQNRIGALSQRLYDELTGIQWGTRPDPFGWDLRCITADCLLRTCRSVPSGTGVTAEKEHLLQMRLCAALRIPFHTDHIAHICAPACADRRVLLHDKRCLQIVTFVISEKRIACLPDRIVPDPGAAEHLQHLRPDLVMPPAGAVPNLRTHFRMKFLLHSAMQKAEQHRPMQTPLPVQRHMVRAIQSPNPRRIPLPVLHV